MLPRFSLRIALVALTLAALFSLVIAAAVREELWAIAVVVAVGSVFLALVVHGLFYGLTRFVGAIAVPRDRKAPNSESGA